MERIKLLLTLDIDPETGDTTCVNREIINSDIVDKKTKKKVSKDIESVEDNPNPKVTLLDNKYILNEAAANLLGVQPEDRIDIKYQKQGKTTVPVIGSNESFGTKGGNKLTNSLSVSCRGKAHDELLEFGDIFSIEKHPTSESLFVLKGNKERVEPIPADTKVDSVEDIDINDLLDESSEKDITEMDFKF